MSIITLSPLNYSLEDCLTTVAIPSQTAIKTYVDNNMGLKKYDYLCKGCGSPLHNNKCKYCGGN